MMKMIPTVFYKVLVVVQKVIDLWILKVSHMVLVGKEKITNNDSIS